MDKMDNVEVAKNAYEQKLAAVNDAVAELVTEMLRGRRHIHECGSCGQKRECWDIACFYNGLADCDPGYGCRSV